MENIIYLVSSEIVLASTSEVGFILFTLKLKSALVHFLNPSVSATQSYPGMHRHLPVSAFFTQVQIKFGSPEMEQVSLTRQSCPNLWGGSLSTQNWLCHVKNPSMQTHLLSVMEHSWFSPQSCSVLQLLCKSWLDESSTKLRKVRLAMSKICKFFIVNLFSYFILLLLCTNFMWKGVQYLRYYWVSTESVCILKVQGHAWDTEKPCISSCVERKWRA